MYKLSDLKTQFIFLLNQFINSESHKYNFGTQITHLRVTS